ncbi:hypothetical protein F2Q70_00000090 [Brassica cretica]|uniref:NAC domain-containing protein n=1 Tax=Brassica cretica TaxID=69181 RepID=A0A8S9IMN4_BRACR|nr:hypothetical protein F2Q70_00000090 [Brassica cretica]
MKGTGRSHFKPTNFELLNILHWRLVRGKRCSFITDMQNLYERAPWLLQHVRHVRFRENEWFYFVRRNKRPGMQKADSTRPSRTVGESGIWKTSGVVAQIKNQDGANVGLVSNSPGNSSSFTLPKATESSREQHGKHEVEDALLETVFGAGDSRRMLCACSATRSLKLEITYTSTAPSALQSGRKLGGDVTCNR